MEGSITTRPLDYLGLLVAASVWALCSDGHLCQVRGGVACVGMGGIILWFCTGRRVLLGEVAVKSGMTELEQSLKALGAGVEASGILLDFFPAGPILRIDGVKALICWERLVLAQLVEA